MRPHRVEGLHPHQQAKEGRLTLAVPVDHDDDASKAVPRQIPSAHLPPAASAPAAQDARVEARISQHAPTKRAQHTKQELRHETLDSGLAGGASRREKTPPIQKSSAVGRALEPALWV